MTSVARLPFPDIPRVIKTSPHPWHGNVDATIEITLIFLHNSSFLLGELSNACTGLPKAPRLHRHRLWDNEQFDRLCERDRRGSACQVPILGKPDGFVSFASVSSADEGRHCPHAEIMDGS